MAKAILIMFLSSLTIIGLYDIIKSIKTWFFKPKDSSFSIVLPIRDNDENVELKIRSLSNFLDSKDCHSQLIIANLGMDFDTLQTCHSAAKQNSNIIICTPEEIKHFACETFGIAGEYLPANY